jgi:hypothetical protein
VHDICGRGRAMALPRQNPPGPLESLRAVDHTEARLRKSRVAGSTAFRGTIDTSVCRSRTRRFVC